MGDRLDERCGVLCWLGRRWWLGGLAVLLSGAVCLGQLWLVDAAERFGGWDKLTTKEWFLAIARGELTLDVEGTPFEYTREYPELGDLSVRKEWRSHWLGVKERSWVMSHKIYPGDLVIGMSLCVDYVERSSGWPWPAYGYRLYSCLSEARYSRRHAEAFAANSERVISYRFDDQSIQAEDIRTDLRGMPAGGRQLLGGGMSVGLPQRVLWWGVTGNLVFWWVVFFGVMLVAGVVLRLVRRVCGRCVGCGYDVGVLSVCPECGRQGMSL